MGFVPIVRQRALSRVQWVSLLYSVIAPQPAEAEIIYDTSDTDSEAEWYPEEKDIEEGKS